MEITKENVFKLVCELQYKKPEVLKSIYFDLFGHKLESFRNRNTIIERLAYRMQEIAYGGLSKETKKKLKDTLSYKEDPTKPKFRSGTIIRKEYKGKNYEVLICDDFYIFEDLQYKSLSAIAKKITGTNWNGRVFFNVK